MRIKRHILTWKSNCNLKDDKKCRTKLKMIQQNMKKRLLNWNEKVKSGKVNRFLINPLSSQIHWIKQQCKTKTIPKSSILALEIIFWFKEDADVCLGGGGEGSSRDVYIITGGVLLNDDAWLQRGEGG